MIEPRFALGRLETLLDRPAQTGDGEFVQFRDVRSECHEEGHVISVGSEIERRINSQWSQLAFWLDYVRV